MRRRGVAVLAVATGGALAAGALVASGGDGDAAAQDRRTSGATAVVERRTLVDRLRVDGTLGYADERPVEPPLRGTVTWLPGEGAVVSPGGALLEVDGDPVLLLDGTVPAWRALRAGLEGRDVRQLEQGLADLGFDPGAVDGSFDADTAAAVADLQDARGLRATGRLELGRIAFLPGRRRIARRDAKLGTALRGTALTTTSTRRVVTLDVDAADQQVAREGARVDVELPDGRLATGRVARVGRVAQTPDPQDGGEGTPTVEVVVRLTGRERGGRLDQAPVSVELARERRRGVLAVPVTALVALRGGGYAVERVTAGRQRRRVRVTPGLVADGLVEVEGALREGDRVEVPST